MTRRELLQQMAALMAAVAACRREPAKPDAQASAPDAQPAIEARALHPNQRAILAAAIARVLPADHEPGAAEADVIEYVDRELARADFAPLKARILAGLTALNRLSMRAANQPFVALAAPEQDRVLRETESGSARGKDFLFVLTILTLEGFFGDPRWGGNKGGAGWALAGYGPGSIDGEVHGHH